MKSAVISVCGSTKNSQIFQYLAVFTGTLNILSSGMQYGWSSPSIPKLLAKDSHIPTTDEEASWIAVILLCGDVCGSILGATFLDRIGRKYAILFTSGPFFISWIMIAFAQSIPVLMAARFIAGISDGLMFCSIPMYIGEISDPGIRGMFGSYVSVAWISGMLIINIIGSYLSIQTTALISALVPIITLVTFCWMPKSPYFLIMKGRLDEARRSLVILKGTEDVDDELKRLVQAVEEQMSNSGKFWDLFTVKSNRKAVYVVMGTRGAQQFTGTTAFTFYAQIIFKEAGNSITPTMGSNIYFAVQLLLCAVSSAIVDRAGRKPLMIVSIIGTCFTLLTVGSYFAIQNLTDIDTNPFSFVPIVALIVFVVAVSIGMQTVPFLFLGEMFPTNVKAFAVSFADIYLAAVTTTASKFFQITKDNFGIHVPFFGFAMCCVLGLLFIIFYVPETKGKNLEEIQAELKGEKSKSQDMCVESFKKIEHPL